MKTGRPAKSKRCPFGQRLYNARIEKGLSQKYLAESLGITQQSYASWERHNVSISPDDIAKLSKLLEISTDELLGLGKNNAAKKQSGPTGRARKVFEEVCELPRHHQQQILSTVQDMLVARKIKKES